MENTAAQINEKEEDAKEKDHKPHNALHLSGYTCIFVIFISGWLVLLLKPWLCLGHAGPAGLCQQVCFVKVTRVESNLLVQSSKRFPPQALPSDPQEALGTAEPQTSDDQAPGFGTDKTLDSEQTSGTSPCAVQSSRSKSLSEDQPRGVVHEESPPAVDPSDTAVTTESCEPAQHSGAPSSDMPFLTPEVTEDPEGRKSPNLTSEMPFLTLAVQSSDNNTLLNPNESESFMCPQNVVGETSMGSKAPNWCLNPFQEDASQSQSSDPDTNKELLEVKDGDEARAASIPSISHHPKPGSERFGCSATKDSPLSANTNALSSESPSTSYNPNPRNKPSSPQDEADLTSSALPNLFEESSSIWKNNVSYQNPDDSELVSYALWVEPRCQQVKCPDPSDLPEKSLTFTDLEPSAVHHSGSELLSSPDRPQRSDSSSESGEEHSMSESEYGESGMEPGEIRSVSTRALTST